MVPFLQFDSTISPIVELSSGDDVSSRVFIGDSQSIVGIVIGDTLYTEVHVSHMYILYTCTCRYIHLHKSLGHVGSRINNSIHTYILTKVFHNIILAICYTVVIILLGYLFIKNSFRQLFVTIYPTFTGW